MVFPAFNKVQGARPSPYQNIINENLFTAIFQGGKGCSKPGKGHSKNRKGRSKTGK